MANRINFQFLLTSLLLVVSLADGKSIKVSRRHNTESGAASSPNNVRIVEVYKGYQNPTEPVAEASENLKEPPAKSSDSIALATLTKLDQGIDIGVDDKAKSINKRTTGENLQSGSQIVSFLNGDEAPNSAKVGEKRTAKSISPAEKETQSRDSPAVVPSQVNADAMDAGIDTDERSEAKSKGSIRATDGDGNAPAEVSSASAQNVKKVTFDNQNKVQVAAAASSYGYPNMDPYSLYTTVREKVSNMVSSLTGWEGTAYGQNVNGAGQLAEGHALQAPAQAAEGEGPQPVAFIKDLIERIVSVIMAQIKKMRGGAGERRKREAGKPGMDFRCPTFAEFSVSLLQAKKLGRGRLAEGKLYGPDNMLLSEDSEVVNFLLNCAKKLVGELETFIKEKGNIAGNANLLQNLNLNIK